MNAAFRWITAAWFYIAVLVALSLAQQPPLRIDSPRDGTVVHPGETVEIAVSSPSRTVAGGIFVIGEGPIGFSGPISTLPGRVSLRLPATINPGEYRVSAIGDENGKMIVAAISLHVELPDSAAHKASGENASTIEKITADDELILESQGQEYALSVTAIYSDGNYLDITRSSRVTFASANQQVATVRGDGMVTALAPGSTMIAVTYEVGDRSFRATVKVEVEGNIFVATPTSLNFGSVPVGSTSSKRLTISYKTDNPTIYIKRIDITGDYSQTSNCLSVAQERTAQSCIISITFHPKHEGRSEGRLRIFDNFRAAETVIPLTGTTAGSASNPQK